MREKTERIAKEFHIMDNVEKLQNELLDIAGISEVWFDLTGFYDDLGEVIFMTKYAIPVTEKNYFEKVKQLKMDVIKVANNNGLSRTKDAIEDYGNAFYFVMQHNQEWKK